MKPRLLLYSLRLLLIILALAAWFGTQSLISHRTDTPSDPFTRPIGDKLLDLLAPVNTYLHDHLSARNALLISSSAVIDLLSITVLAKALFGKTLRPFVGLLVVFALRQICQAICILPAPPGMIWPAEGPGFPSLLVTYGVGNDLFFSGHTALAVWGATELARISKWLIPVGILLALFEMLTMLSLRAHWTMDVYAGAVTALLVACVAQKLADPIDRLLPRFPSKEKA